VKFGNFNKKNSFLGEFFIIKKQEFVPEYNFFSIYFSQYDEKLPPKTRKKKKKREKTTKLHLSSSPPFFWRIVEYFYTRKTKISQLLCQKIMEFFRFFL
jgi:hypothetical protein